MKNTCFLFLMLVLWGNIVTGDDSIPLRSTYESQKETIVIKEDEIIIQGKLSEKEKKLSKMKTLDRLERNTKKQKEKSARYAEAMVEVELMLLEHEMRKEEARAGRPVVVVENA